MAAVLPVIRSCHFRASPVEQGVADRFSPWSARVLGPSRPTEPVGHAPRMLRVTLFHDKVARLDLGLVQQCTTVPLGPLQDSLRDSRSCRSSVLPAPRGENLGGISNLAGAGVCLAGWSAASDREGCGSLATLDPALGQSAMTSPGRGE